MFCFSVFGIICCYHGNAQSRHCPKMCHAQLHFNVNMYAKFDLKCISPSIFGIICRYHGNTLSSTVKKYVLHNYTIRPPCVPKFHFKCLKKCGSSSNPQSFPHFLALICCYHGNAHFHHCQRMYLTHHLTANMWAKFYSKCF